jgi:hypothetical protein
MFHKKLLSDKKRRSSPTGIAPSGWLKNAV